MDNLLRIFDKEVRANPVYPDVVKVIKDRYLVRLEGPGSFNFISYWDIPEQQATKIVHNQIESLKKNGGQVMWRVYDHDLPKDLEIILDKEAFKKLDTVTLMMLPLQEFVPDEHDLDIRKIKDESGIADFLSVTEAAFGQPSPQQLDYHARLITYPNFNYYVGYSDNIPVAAARFEIPDNSRFGFFFGGCVTPEFRGKGFYKALINTRLKEAKSIGLEYIGIDAKETSRPILEQMGFTSLVKGRTWHWAMKD